MAPNMPTGPRGCWIRSLLRARAKATKRTEREQYERAEFGYSTSCHLFRFEPR